MAGPGGTITLTSGDDVFPGAGDDNSGDETIFGLGGADIISGGAGIDTILGGDGDDQLVDFSGANGGIDGGDGDDWIHIDPQLLSATIDGGAGSDELFVIGPTDLWAYEISGVELLRVEGGPLTATAAQLASFDFILYSFIPATINLVATGAAQTLDLTGKLVLGGYLALSGSSDDETVTSGDSNDILHAGSGNDNYRGGGDDDRLHGEAGDDTLDGGAGSDEASYADASGFVTVHLGVAQAQDIGGGLGFDRLRDIENVTGGEFGNLLTGNAGTNILNGGGGADRLYGAAGDDVLIGGDGRDRIFGGGGNDSIEDIESVFIAGPGAKTYIDAGDGDDYVMANDMSGTFIGGGGFDTFFVGPSSIDLSGVAVSGFEQLLTNGLAITATAAQLEAFDVIRFNAWDSVGTSYLLLAASGGPQTLDLAQELNDGAAPRDVYLTATASDETIAVGNGVDNVSGAAGDDVIRGNGGNDYLEGNDGNDRLLGGEGIDYAAGGDGADRIDGGAGNDTLEGLAGVDHISGGLDDDQLHGGDDNDAWLGGDGGNDLISGDTGNDRMDGGAGTDTLNGGAGFDFITGGGDSDTIFGGDGDDGNGLGVLRGEAGDDLIAGEAGIDRLEGGDGNDQLSGGGGNDVLVGGAGIDRFRFSLADGGNDRIDDWAVDQISVSAADFGGSLISGPLDAARLIVGAAPVADQAFGQFLYSTVTGQLSWDADGTGAGAAVMLARLLNAGAPAVSLATVNFDIMA
jgi:Ca2+-binding RTX toxin-like protein